VFTGKDGFFTGPDKTFNIATCIYGTLGFATIAYYPRLCRSLADGGQKLVLGTSLLEFNSLNSPLLEANFSHRGHDSANLGEKSIFPRFRA
jgi:hypothetical protein